ncbi:hypothetical protein [Nautilia lithotrophica]
MHRYDELEKLYYKNKIKKYSLIIFLVILVIFIGWFFYQNYTSSKKTDKETKINIDFKKITNQTKSIKSNIIKKDINLTSKENIKNNDQNKTKTTSKIDTSLEKNKTEKKESITPNLSFVIPEIKEENKTNKRIIKKTQIKEKNRKIKEITKQNKQIIPTIKEEQINITELIKSFNKHPSYDTAIVISRYYYNNNELKNAKLWALKANNIDPAKYESWKMFALILLKKNDKIKAKEVLKIYLNDYGDNDEIYKLLRSIDE